MNREIKKRRIWIWGGAGALFFLFMIIGALLPADNSAVEARNAGEWEKQLREGAQAFYGPGWKPTKADEAMLRSAGRVSAEKMGPAPTND